MTVEQVVQVAVTAEQHAAEFYEKCAGKYPEHERLFSSLASDEKKHAGLFNLLSAGQADEATDEQVEKLTALAEMAGTEGDLSEVLLTDDATPVEILAHAIEGEKNAVLLYLGLKDRVTGEALGTLDMIIEDEMGHVAKLYQMAKEV